MLIGVLKEIKTKENRVAMTPAGARSRGIRWKYLAMMLPLCWYDPITIWWPKHSAAKVFY